METSTSRFVEITDKKLIEFVEEQENPNAKRKTAYDVELCEGRKAAMKARISQYVQIYLLLLVKFLTIFNMPLVYTRPQLFKGRITLSAG